MAMSFWRRVLRERHMVRKLVRCTHASDRARTRAITAQRDRLETLA
jgi:hypothetical protein